MEADFPHVRTRNFEEADEAINEADYHQMDPELDRSDHSEMDEQSRHESHDSDNEDGTEDDLADPGSLYADGLQQTRHDNHDEQEGLDSESSDDDNSDREEEDHDESSSYNTMELYSGQTEADWLSYISRLSDLATLDNMKTAMAFIEALKIASLDDEWSKLDADTLYQLRNPSTTPVDINENPSWRLGLDLYLSISNVSQETYTSVRKAILRRYPDEDIPSYYLIKKYVAELSGVCSIEHDMCINSCIAYTGPFKELQTCPECGEPRFDPFTRKPRQQLHTIPLGPQLQAIRRGAQSSMEANYRLAVTEKILEDLDLHEGKIPLLKDFFFGQAYIDKVDEGFIKENDMVLMFSMDGAQLYCNKSSDCWIYIWILFDYIPGTRYKKKCVLIGGFIPGPNKPKHADSFTFPGIHHLAALQREGLPIWDCITNTVNICHPFFSLATADGPGMTYLNGLVGHHGKSGCRLFCSLPGRHKRGKSHYYPALLKPINYSVAGSDHPDIDINNLPSMSREDYEQKLVFVVQSPNETQYKKRRLDTGIVKPSIFLGLNPRYRLDIPACFGSDIMHLAALNIPDLLMSLWRGTLDCDNNDDRGTWDWVVLTGRTWEEHGRDVAACTPYLPGSFDRPPRNPAEKISSGFKAWEFLIYIYGLGPALFYGILPEKYWINFCKLVYGMRIILQHEIKADDLAKAHCALLEFCGEFEVLYCQRLPERLHFVRQSIHALTHLAPETVRIGPAICSSQWTMERTIGNLVAEIRQDSNPYANLSQRGLERSQVNALKAIYPDLDEEANSIPRGAIDLGDDFVLLRAKERTFYKLSPEYLTALKIFLLKAYNMVLPEEISVSVQRWARLNLPTGQVARSRWKESLKPLVKVRMARNVKVNHIQVVFLL
jgi:hypothetical protein